jgi:hypothetical protein
MVHPTILKVCCCVCMLLLVLLNDCVTFFVDLEFLLLIDLHFCRTLSIIVVVVILILFASFQDLSSHLQLSSLNVMFLLMELMIVMDSWISGDVMLIWFV